MKKVVIKFLVSLIVHKVLGVRSPGGFALFTTENNVCAGEGRGLDEDNNV